jgi:hypothetical protein
LRSTIFASGAIAESSIEPRFRDVLIHCSR